MRIRAIVFAFSLLLLMARAGLADSNGEFPGKGDYESWKTASNLVDEGIELAKRGAFQQAISVYNRAATVYPHDSSVFYNRGVAQKKLGDFAGAIESFSKASTLEPGFASAWYNLGNAYDAAGKIADAEKPLRQAIRLDSSHFNSQFNLGVNLFKQNKFDEARSVFEQASKLALNDQDRADIQGYKDKLAKLPSGPKSTTASP